MKKLFTIILLVASVAMGQSMGQSMGSQVKSQLSPITDVRANIYQGSSYYKDLINIHLSFVDQKTGSFVATFSTIDSVNGNTELFSLDLTDQAIQKLKYGTTFQGTAVREQILMSVYGAGFAPVGVQPVVLIYGVHSNVSQIGITIPELEKAQIFVQLSGDQLNALSEAIDTCIRHRNQWLGLLGE